MDCSMQDFLVLRYLLEFAQSHVHWVNDVIQPSHLLSPRSPSAFFFPSIKVFSRESALRIRWPKYWNFSFSISPFIECSGLIFFLLHWFDPLAVQGTVKSLCQHLSSKALTLQCLAFFMVQLSHPYMTIGKTIALTLQAFVSTVISLVFNTRSRFIIAFLSRSKHLGNREPDHKGSVDCSKYWILLLSK